MTYLTEIKFKTIKEIKEIKIEQCVVPEDLDLFQTFNDLQKEIIYTQEEELRKVAYKVTRRINEEVVQDRVMPEKLYNIINKKETVDKSYYQFKIPKRKGGYRTITAPNDDLKKLQKDLVEELQKKFMAHTAAYAYEKGRCCKDAIIKHQQNKSEWFLKLDIKDFFPSCDITTVETQLKKLYNFKNLTNNTQQSIIQALEILAYTDLVEGLPQGTPISPFLSNIIMTAFDYRFTDYCYKHGLRYTRYADDLLISGKKYFSVKETIKVIEEIFIEENYPFKINKEKTKYCNNKQSNWNLGLVLNKDNNITIGYKNKKNLKNAIHYFMLNKDVWEISDTQVLLGQLEYLKSNEPDYYAEFEKYLIKKYKSNPREELIKKLKQ